MNVLLTLFTLIVLRNPLLFLLLLLIAGGTYVAYHLNLLGPMMHMGNAAFTQGIDIGKERLREYIMNSEAAKQAIGVQANSGNTTDVGMDRLDSHGKKVETSKEDDDI
jgi:protein SEY1